MAAFSEGNKLSLLMKIWWGKLLRNHICITPSNLRNFKNQRRVARLAPAPNVFQGRSICIFSCDRSLPSSQAKQFSFHFFIKTHFRWLISFRAIDGPLSRDEMRVNQGESQENCHKRELIWRNERNWRWFINCAADVTVEISGTMMALHSSY